MTNSSKNSSEKSAYQAVFTRPNSTENLVKWTSFDKACQRVKIACEQKYPLITLKGLSGTGKTSLVRWLYDNLDEDHFEVFLTGLTTKEIKTGWLLDRLGKFLGVRNPKSFHEALLAKLQELVGEERHLVVIIDGAEKIQNEEACEEIETLLSMQTLSGACLSFFLVGSDDVLSTLIKHNQALDQYHALNVELKSLNSIEWLYYIRTRLEQAERDPDLFSKDCAELIFEISHGNLRKANILAENSLIEMQISGSESVESRHVLSAAEAAMLDIQAYRSLIEDKAKTAAAPSSQSTVKKALRAVPEKPANEESKKQDNPKPQTKKPQNTFKKSQDTSMTSQESNKEGPGSNEKSKVAWSSLVDDE